MFRVGWMHNNIPRYRSIPMAAFGEMELSVFASRLKTSWCRGGGEREIMVPTLSGSVCID